LQRNYERTRQKSYENVEKDAVEFTSALKSKSKGNKNMYSQRSVAGFTCKKPSIT
jgi:hypothetical protein